MNIWILYSVLEENADYSSLVESLGDYAGRTIFAHFQDEYTEYPGINNIVVDSFNNSKAWNQGIQYAKSNGATHILVAKNIENLNLSTIIPVIEANEFVPVINFSDGGLFSITADYEFTANEEYSFWFADSELFEMAQEDGAILVYRAEDLSFNEILCVTRKEDYDLAVQSDIEKANQ
jgi:hypothetical protein